MESAKDTGKNVEVNEYQDALDGVISVFDYNDERVTDCEWKHITKLQELVNRATPPNDFDEAMKFHRMALQEHLGAIARLQEICSENEFGSKNYILSKEIIEEYLNTECECAVEQVIEDLHSYLDWSKDE